MRVKSASKKMAAPFGKAVAVLVSLSLALSPSLAFAQVQAGSGQFGGGGGSSSTSITWSGATEYSSAGTYNSLSYTSSTDGQNAVLIDHSSGTVALTSPTVTKTGSGGTSDEYNFYGINAAIMCKGNGTYGSVGKGSTTKITGGTVTTSANGANAVFCYGGYPSTSNTSTDGTTVEISGTTINTTGDGAGGIMTTGGGTMVASDLTITTTGGSSAPIRTDRGGGDVDVTGGTYTSSGVGSPAIYSVTDVDVSGATLVSNKSEGVVIEGAGSIELNDSCSLTGNNTSLNGNAQFYNTVMIYQSMSGDASDGTSLFSMNGGTLTSKNGHVFHITNTDGKVNLTGVAITNEDSNNVLLSVCDDGWSTSGQTAVVNAANQTLEGAMLVGSNSTLTLNLTGTSVWTGATSGSITNGKNSSVSSSLGTVNVSLADTSLIVLDADTTISSISGTGMINYNGHTLTVGNATYTSGSPGVATIEESAETAADRDNSSSSSDAGSNAGNSTNSSTSSSTTSASGSSSGTSANATTDAEKEAATALAATTATAMSAAAVKSLSVDSSIPKIAASNISITANVAKKTMTVKVKTAVSGAANYIIAYKLAKASSWNYSTTGGALKYVIRGLKAKGLVQFRVAAVKDGKRGAWSAVNYRYYKRAVGLKAKAGANSATITWKKNTNATGYQVFYGTSKSSVKKATVKGKKAVKKVLKNLKKGKKYYVRVCPVKKYGGKTYIGILSGWKTVKVK